MSRMIDRLYAHGTMQHRGDVPAGEHLSIEALVGEDGRALFANAQAFVIDNVTEYLFAETDQETWGFEDDFPCVTPPFPSCWMETRQPSSIFSDGVRAAVPPSTPYGWGVLFETTRLTAETWNTLRPDAVRLRTQLEQELERQRPLLAALESRAQHLGRRLTWEELSKEEQIPIRLLQAWEAIRTPDYVMAFESLTEALGETPAWRIQGWMFMEYTKGVIHGPMALFALVVNAHGAALPMPHPDGHRHPLTFATFLPLAHEQQVQLVGELRSLLFPFWLALSFCHCKNVTVTTQQHLLRGKPQQYRGRPRVVYHLLNIHPMRQVLRGEGQVQTQGLRRALHICRGHFKDYSQGKGLFGRLPGLYWWDSHLRGTSQAGITIKDYTIAPATS